MDTEREMRKSPRKATRELSDGEQRRLFAAYQSDERPTVATLCRRFSITQTQFYELKAAREIADRPTIRLTENWGTRHRGTARG